MNTGTARRAHLRDRALELREEVDDEMELRRRFGFERLFDQPRVAINRETLQALVDAGIHPIEGRWYSIGRRGRQDLTLTPYVEPVLWVPAWVNVALRATVAGSKIRGRVLKLLLDKPHLRRIFQAVDALGGLSATLHLVNEIRERGSL